MWTQHPGQPDQLCRIEDLSSIRISRNYPHENERFKPLKNWWLEDDSPVLSIVPFPRTFVPFFFWGGWSNVLECSPNTPLVTILVAWLCSPRVPETQEVLLNFSPAATDLQTLLLVFCFLFQLYTWHMNRQIGTIDLHMANIQYIYILYIRIYTHMHTLYNSIISLSLYIYIHPHGGFQYFCLKKNCPLIRGRFPLLNASFFQWLGYPRTAASGSIRSQDQPGKRPLVVGKWKPLESFESLNGTHLENDLNQTSMIMFHVNLQGCKKHILQLKIFFKGGFLQNWTNRHLNTFKLL